MSRPISPRRFASPAETAEYMNVSVKTIKKLIKSGRINGYRVTDRLIRIDLDEVDAMLLTPVVGG